MCGIAGQISLSRQAIPRLRRGLEVMNTLQKHRGPDGEGLWEHAGKFIGFGHRRLSIIDLATGAQPMTDGAGNWITFNGEIYNYLELRGSLVSQFRLHIGHRGHSGRLSQMGRGVCLPSARHVRLRRLG